MNIAGILIHAYPKFVQTVNDQLLKISGVEVHATTDEGKMVVTAENDDDHALADTVMKFQYLDGVLSAAMIYHHYDECDPSEQEA